MVRQVKDSLGIFGLLMVVIGFICLGVLFFLTNVLPFFAPDTIDDLMGFIHWIFLT